MYGYSGLPVTVCITGIRALVITNCFPFCVRTTGYGWFIVSTGKFLTEINYKILLIKAFVS